MDEPKPEPLRRAARRCYRMGEPIAALKKLDQLIGLKLADADDWHLTGRLLCELGEFAQAIGALENCLQLDPSHVEARYELGRAAYKLGDTDRAAKLIEQVAQETGQLEVWMGLATIAPAVPSYDHARVKQIREKFARLTRQAEAVPEASQSNHKLSRSLSDTARVSRRGTPLRLGYVSAHWHEANYMKPVWPLVAAHDRAKFQLHLFDDGSSRAGDQQDDVWQWLPDGVLTESIHQLDNRRAAERIAAAGLDILVDLSAYGQPARMGLFVHRPAPIQMAWFNMYATSGFEEIDYLIGDHWVTRSDERQHYTERCLQLPLSYLTFQTNHDAPDVAPRSTDHQTGFAFGCLGTLYKLCPQVIDTWAEILKQAGGSELVLSARELKSPCNQQYVLDQFVRRDVSAKRITFLPPAPHYDFLKHYARIDLALDTFPYNGGTTTMEALWQGVPVLAVDGDRWVSRTSRSLLANSHLGQFAVRSREEYIRAAVGWASSPEKRAQLSSLRQTMREKLVAAKVCDSRLLARKLEDFYLRAKVECCDLS